MNDWKPASPVSPRQDGYQVAKETLPTVIFVLACLLLGYSYFALGSAASTGRICQPAWTPASPKSRMKIALVTLSDAAAKRNTSGTARGSRDFGGILEATRENKEKYAALHGYTYFDHSRLLDRSRPPSWSKILAVQEALREFDWVFWIDADTLITRPSMPLEDVLPAGGFPDLLVTKDGGGYNAGVWIIRRSAWSSQFLARWWRMASFIRRTPGDTKSGDNDALKHLLAVMPRETRDLHVGEVPQCAINSYMWRSSFRNWLRYITAPSSVSLGLYQPNDFLLHLAGVGNKLAVIKAMLPSISYTA